MTKGRLEAFSDGVIAIIITIMVLEMKVPHGEDLAALKPLIPVLLSYVLSFAFVGIYWNNHHHMLHASQRVNGPVLWANLIAWPAAYLVMNWWLQGFAYHVDLAPWTFVAAAAGALAVAWATVFIHALRVARAKPVGALRYE